jgi:hypothetical protein
MLRWGPIPPRAKDRKERSIGSLQFNARGRHPGGEADLSGGFQDPAVQEALSTGPMQWQARWSLREKWTIWRYGFGVAGIDHASRVE